MKFLSEEEIFRKYIPYKFEIGEITSAPYRVDKKPSFGVYYNRQSDKLMWKDLSKKEGGDCFKFVQKMHNECSFWEACQIINKDFQLNLGGNYGNTRAKTIVNRDEISEYSKERKKISIVKQDFTQIDVEYWSEFGIINETLKKFNVFSCRSYSVDGEVRRFYVPNYPIYAYYFPRTGNYKIYIPNEQNKWAKWATNASNDLDIQGYDQLPESGDLIYITKSMKDCMALYEVGYNAVATHAEGNWINPDFIRHLKGRFKRIILFYDNDTAGKECASKIALELKLEVFFIPDSELIENNIKDFADYVRTYGKSKGKDLLTGI